MIERKIKLIRLNKLFFFSIFFKLKKKPYINSRLFFQLKNFKILFGLSLLFILLNMYTIKETHNNNSRDDIRFITCYFGVDEIKSNHRIRKYFQVLDNYVPYANVVFCVSEYTRIDPILIQHKKITINIERFGNKDIENLLNKYPYSSHFFHNGIRYYFQFLADSFIFAKKLFPR